MTSGPYIENIGSRQFSLLRSGGQWHAYRRCFCILGPHWHHHHTAPTIAALREEIKGKS